MPENRRGNGWARSNWLSSPYLAKKGNSRSESISEIERAPSKPAVVRLMQVLCNPNFAWNFWSLSTKSTIEFRQPPGSVCGADALAWAELALNFVQAATRFGTSGHLASFSSNVKGLQRFLRQVNEPDLNEPERLARLWNGVSPYAAFEPTYVEFTADDDEIKIEKMIKKDLEAIKSHPQFRDG